MVAQTVPPAVVIDQWSGRPGIGPESFDIQRLDNHHRRGADPQPFHHPGTDPGMSIAKAHLPGRHPLPEGASANLSIPLVAPSFARCSCSAASRCTTTVSAAATVGELDEASETENISIGGSALTDATDVAVSATGPAPASAVTSATPAGCARKAAVKRLGVEVVDTNVY